MAEDLEKRLDAFQHKNELEHRSMVNTISEVKTSVSNLSEKVKENFETLENNADGRIGKLDGRIGKLEDKVDELGKQVEAILAHIFWIRTIIAIGMGTVAISFLGGVIKWVFFSS